MLITDVTAILGIPKSTQTSPSSSTTTYRWYEYVENEPGRVYAGIRHEEEGGLSVTADRSGAITAVQVYFDSRYNVQGVLHTTDRKSRGARGVTEEQVRGVLGQPTQVTVRRGPTGEPDAHALVYANRGVTFWIGDNPKTKGYNEVYEIVVYAAR